jgi:hypothetical protein
MSLHLVAYFFGGAFAANSIAHLVAGVSGRSHPTPFASPPFRGPSPPATNVGWGLFNLAMAYLLVLQVGAFDPRRWVDALACGAGFALMALQSARSMQRVLNLRQAPAEQR